MNELTINFSNKRLCSLILPLIVEQFLATTVGLADSIMVASVGEAAVSAVSLVDSINTLVFYGFAAPGYWRRCGLRAVYRQPRPEKSQRIGRAAFLVFIVLLAAGLTAVLYITKYFILHGLFGNIDQEVMDHANTYFIIVEASIPLSLSTTPAPPSSASWAAPLSPCSFHRHEHHQCRGQRPFDLRFPHGCRRRCHPDPGFENHRRYRRGLAPAQ